MKTVEFNGLEHATAEGVPGWPNPEEYIVSENFLKMKAIESFLSLGWTAFCKLAAPRDAEILDRRPIRI